MINTFRYVLILFCLLGIPLGSLGAWAWGWSNFEKDYLEFLPPVVELRVQGPRVQGTLGLEVRGAPGIPRDDLGASYLVFLPPGARITGLEARMNGEWISGQWFNAVQAGRVYKGVVNRELQKQWPRDPVVVQWLGPDLYRVNLFPVKPGNGGVRLSFEFATPASEGAWGMPWPRDPWFGPKIPRVPYTLIRTLKSGEKISEPRVLFHEEPLVWEGKEKVASGSSEPFVHRTQSLLALEKNLAPLDRTWGRDLERSSLSLGSDDGFGGLNLHSPSHIQRLYLLFLKYRGTGAWGDSWERYLERILEKRLAPYQAGNLAEVVKTFFQDFPGPNWWQDRSQSTYTNFSWRDLTKEDLAPFSNSVLRPGDPQYRSPERVYFQQVLRPKPQFLALQLALLVDKFDYYGLWKYPLSPYELFKILADQGLFTRDYFW